MVELVKIRSSQINDCAFCVVMINALNRVPVTARNVPGHYIPAQAH